MSRLVLWLRYAKKAVAPAVVGFMAAVTDALISWSIDWAQLRYTAAGIVTALVVFWAENEPRDTGDVAAVPPEQRLDFDGGPLDYAEAPPDWPVSANPDRTITTHHPEIRHTHVEHLDPPEMP